MSCGRAVTLASMTTGLMPRSKSTISRARNTSHTTTSTRPLRHFAATHANNSASSAHSYSASLTIIPGLHATTPPYRAYASTPSPSTGPCAGNPGPMEYRAVRVADGSEVFHIGANQPLTGTNNIAEYLAMIHLAALLAREGDFTTPIYTDSRNTLAWLKRGRSKTTLAATPKTEKTLALLARADAWLAANGPIRNPIIKWPTEEWGEIPADFGRK